jgi:hypothetical protein
MIEPVRWAEASDSVKNVGSEGDSLMDGSSERLSRERLALLCRLSQTFNTSLGLDMILSRGRRANWVW